MFKRTLAHPVELPGEVLDENLRLSAGISREVFKGTTSSVRRVSIDPDAIAGLDLPVLLPRANLAIVPEAARSPQLDNPRLVGKLVLAFLQE